MHPHEPHRKQFVKLLQAIGHDEGMRQHEVLCTFLDAGYRAVRGRVVGGEERERNEAEYMRIVKRCQKPQVTMNRLSEMLATTVLALDAHCSDFLGPTFMEIGGSGDLGQFFTPHDVSRMMAMMTMDLDRLIKDSPRGYFTAQEPAAGMGGMVLAVAQLMREQGYEPARHCHWQMIELEFNAMAGCYLQTSLAGVSGIVVHGNTLTLAEFGATPTPMAALFPKRFDSAPATPRPSAGPPAAPPRKAGQLAFDFST